MTGGGAFDDVLERDAGGGGVCGRGRKQHKA